MRRLQSLITHIILFILLLFPPMVQNSSAESTIDCHCFKNRDYNSTQKFAADDYILTTSFNSLLAKAFGISKRQIVMLKMKGGVGGNDLLIGLKAAELTGVELEQLLGLRKQMPWQTILSSQSLAESIKNDSLMKSIQAGIPADQAAQNIADALIGDFYKIPPEDIEKFRNSGFDEKEMALLFILAHAGKQTPQELAAQYQKEGKSWSEIAYNLNIEPVRAGKLIINY